MILAEDYLRELLERAVRTIDPPETYIAVIEGSIAEGFGNESSDIDLLVIDLADREHRSMPAVLFINHRRVELRVRSAVQVRREVAQLKQLAGSGGSTGVERIPEDLLDRCQRLRQAVALREPERFRELLESLALQDFPDVVSRWFAARARHAARYAAVLDFLGLPEEARSWARTAVQQSAKAWAAQRNETYLSPKWITQQLRRVHDENRTLERFVALDSPEPDMDVTRYVQECMRFVADTGVEVVALEPDQVCVSRAPKVTTWQIGHRVHVLVGKQDVFALSDRAADVWRELRFEEPLSQLLERVTGTPERALIAEFHRLGFISFRWHGSRPIGMRRPCGAPPCEARPVVSLEGAAEVGGGEEPNVRLIALPGRRFASAGMALMWSQMMIENAREDVTGALAAEQWGTLENTVRRLLREACLSLLSGYGVNPLPYTEEACAAVARLSAAPAELKRAVCALHFNLRIANRSDAERAVADVNDIIAVVRERIRAQEFPSCFASAREWRRTVELGYDWARLGSFVDSEFPFDEVRDLLAAAGHRQAFVPHDAGAQQTLSRAD